MPPPSAPAVACVEAGMSPESDIAPSMRGETRMDARPANAWKLCVAPMMEWTDRHCRHFHRLLSPHARLYTEMISTGALLHGPRERLLTFSAQQHPVALQLGGGESAGTRRVRALRRRRRFRRNQSERRVPVGSRAARAHRRVPDARAGTRRRVCGVDARRRRRSGHGEVQNRRRRRGRLRLSRSGSSQPSRAPDARSSSSMRARRSCRA